MLASMYIYMGSSVILTPGASGGAEFSFYVILSSIIPVASIIPVMLIWRLITYYILNILVGYIHTILIFKNNKENNFNE